MASFGRTDSEALTGSFLKTLLEGQFLQAG